MKTKTIKTLEEILNHIRIQVIEKPFQEFKGSDVSIIKEIVNHIKIGKYAEVPNLGSCSCRHTYRRIYDFLKKFYEEKNVEKT